MIFYYSNEGAQWANPELVFHETANLMLTYFQSCKTQNPTSRFKRIIKARKLGRRVRVTFKREA